MDNLSLSLELYTYYKTNKNNWIYITKIENDWYGECITAKTKIGYILFRNNKKSAMSLFHSYEEVITEKIDHKLMKVLYE